MKKLQPVFLGLVLASSLPFFGLLAITTGCQTGTTGLLRPLSPASEHSITNTITLLTTAGMTVTPAPYSGLVELIGGGALAAIAGWQALTHSRLGNLTKKVNGNNSQQKS